MIAYDFTKLNNREHRVYSFQDIKLSDTGISTKFLSIAAICVGITLIILSIIGIITGYYAFNPFKGDEIDFMGPIFSLAVPLSIAGLLHFKKIQHYRVIDFLIIYFKPKNPINLNGDKNINTEVKFNAFLEVQ